MSILFTPFTLGYIELKNRFVFSACEDNLADERGGVTDAVVRKINKIAKGKVALITSGHMIVHRWGRSNKGQLGIDNDQMIPGLRRLAEAVHRESSKIVFQLGHAGITANPQLIRRSPLGPSAKQGEMTDAEIWEVIRAFGAATARAVQAKANGVQLHAAHGYLINQFLSPYFNHRQDAWGGSTEGRSRLLQEIIKEVKRNLSPEMILLIKLNSHDHTPRNGITPELAVDYATLLSKIGVDGIEVSSGNTYLSPWNICRGDVPIREILPLVSESKRNQVEETLEKTKDKFRFDKPYHLDNTILMRNAVGSVPLYAVGGWRKVEDMERAVESGQTDLIPLCRPLIREPLLVKQIEEGKSKAASCINCNRCFIALAYGLPGRCYSKGLPAQALNANT